MKVSRRISRKVGRRSHSSISRRRLRNKKSRSGYRKKHTQRGGKHGKRSRGHKRGRTYKRGKRFHKGGRIYRDFVDINLQVKVEKLGHLNLKSIGSNVYTNKPANDILPKIENLRYIKGKGTNDVRIDDFYVLVEYNKNTDTLDVTLTRVMRPSDKELSFKFTGRSDDVLQQILKCGGVDIYVKNEQVPQGEFGLFKTESYNGGNDLFLKLFNYIREEVKNIKKLDTDTHEDISDSVDKLPPGWASTNPTTGRPLYYKVDDPSFPATFVRPTIQSV